MMGVKLIISANVLEWISQAASAIPLSYGQIYVTICAKFYCNLPIICENLRNCRPVRFLMEQSLALCLLTTYLSSEVYAFQRMPLDLRQSPPRRGASLREADPAAWPLRSEGP